MAPLYRIAGGEPSAAVALAAVAAWQLAIALAEELYYRGMLQGGAGFGLLALADLVAGPASAVPPAVGALTQLVALLFAAAAFGAVHTEFAADGPVVGAADGPGGDEGDSKARWFLQTGAYGAAFGALALLTQHLLAPVAMHATLNVGLCARLAAHAEHARGGAGADLRRGRGVSAARVWRSLSECRCLSV